MKRYFFIIVYVLAVQCIWAQNPIKVLNFQADNGFQHESKSAALEMIETLGANNNWEVVTSSDTSIITAKKLRTFHVLIFNNNCGNAGRIFSNSQQLAIQNYIRNGGGFVGIHCAGAIWKEEGAFQQWYEKLIGTRLVAHPKVLPARLVVENKEHICTCHLSDEWNLTDEWHTFSYNPRENVNVLLSLDESSFEGKPKMGGDHPFTWYQHYDGGRSFFTSLGHTIEIYSDENYQKLVQGGIIWASGTEAEKEMPVSDGLLLDLNADHGIVLEDGMKISSWKNSVENDIESFDKQDKGRKIAGSGRPRLKPNVPQLNGHNSVVFHRQELLNRDEDAFDHLTLGSGYTWFAIISAYEQIVAVKDVNSFFGNLRNTNVDKKGRFEGFWAGLSDNNQFWMGSRNSVTQGRWDHNNPYVVMEESVEKNRYYLVAGRMGDGTDTVSIQFFVNNMEPKAEALFPVNVNGNPSQMAVGQERDATNHPGAESFDGEIARFLIYEKPLTDDELAAMMKYLKETYNIKITK